jgi:Cdc6-like AAA superfamily ATPase
MYRAGRGLYKLPEHGAQSVKNVSVSEVQVGSDVAEVALTAQVIKLKQPVLEEVSESAVPSVFPDYVPFGFFKDLRNIVKSREFYPVFITGLSGNGKTLMVEQVCAELKRECIRVNISIETDENDLLGVQHLLMAIL